MSTVTNVFKGVVLPAALAVTASIALLGPSAWASPQKEEACEGAASDGSARSSGYDVKKVEGTGARDAASGQASGKRDCMAINTKGTGKRTAGPDEDCDGAAEGVKGPRDAASGQASGKREAGTGQATGKREASTGRATGKRDAGSGMATGKRC